MSLGNAWHLPGIAEVPPNAGMRSPVFPADPSTPVTIFSGNQWAGGDGAANQLQDGSLVKYRRLTDATWKSSPVVFDSQVDNNKYYRASIPLAEFAARDQVQYYLVLAYSDRNLTYLGVAENDPTGWFSATLATETAAQSRPFVFTIGTQNEQKPFPYTPETPKLQGKWSEVFTLPNVGAHASLLRTGKVLMWGRRDSATQSMNTFPATPLVPNGPQADAATCIPFLLDPLTLQCTTANAPFMPDNGKLNANLPKISDQGGKANANLFCAGHAFQPDGSLLVAGGHLYDGYGLDQACIYEPMSGTWKAVPAVKSGDEQKDGTVMGNGRWYPTVTPLPTGAALVTSGSYQLPGSENTANNNDTQILSGDVFASVDPTPVQPFDLYPRMHVASSGIVYWVSLADILFLDQANNKRWEAIPAPIDGQGLPMRPPRNYACSVQYNKDQVVYIGGGNPPANTTDILDLSDRNKIAWTRTNDMLLPRRQHNATILPDGSVLVTGGTRGNGENATENAADLSFNDLRPGRPVHIAELWDPNSKTWTTMASEQVDRCYHSTAVLLPDARVLSAGGGEFQLSRAANDQKDSHRNAQIFSPPYLFQDGPRPQIESISRDAIECGSTFEVGTAEPDKIGRISLIGLSSVTHSNNFGQRLAFLTFSTSGGKTLQVDAPPNARSCPPGYYMLFLVTKIGVPSVAQFVQIRATPEALTRHQRFTSEIIDAGNNPPTLLDKRKAIRKAAGGTRIELGITATCPYGLSACWGGAFEALKNLTGVERVDPIPHVSGSTASVFLADNSLPDLDLWTRQFKGFVQDTYGLRGFEAAVAGQVVEVLDNGRGGIALVTGDGFYTDISLVRLEPDGKIQWDKDTQRPQAVTPEEAAAYDRLVQLVSSHSSGSDAGPVLVTVTGPVREVENGGGYQIQVRSFK